MIQLLLLLWVKCGIRWMDISKIDSRGIIRLVVFKNDIKPPALRINRALENNCKPKNNIHNLSGCGFILREIQFLFHNMSYYIKTGSD